MLRITYSFTDVVPPRLTNPKANFRVPALLSDDSRLMEGSTPLVLFFQPPLMGSLDYSVVMGS